MRKITKAVFPVAGLGSRFLPVTKASPKEMMPIVDKPLIQYAVEEAVDAGMTDMVFITGRNKRAIEDHFDKAYEIESELEQRGKTELLRIVRSVVPDHVNCIYIRQPEALGLGHAVLCARPVIGDEPFAVILADDLIDASPSALAQMAGVFEQQQCSILGVEEVLHEQTGSYGIVRTEHVQGVGDRVVEIVEKPRPEVAPSNIAVVGRYILTPRIFHHLANINKGSGGEIQLTDAIKAILAEEKVLAYRFHGKRYDCGSKLGYLQATVDHGLAHSETGAQFRAWLSARGFKG